MKFTFLKFFYRYDMHYLPTFHTLWIKKIKKRVTSLYFGYLPFAHSIFLFLFFFPISICFLKEFSSHFC